jgi:hypothetical protein
VLHALADAGGTHRVNLLAYKQPRTYRVTRDRGRWPACFTGRPSTSLRDGLTG